MQDHFICQQCQMQFTNAVNLGRHIKKFCVNTQHLEDILYQSQKKIGDKHTSEEQLLRLRQRQLKDDLIQVQIRNKELRKSYSNMKQDLKKDILDELLEQTQQKRRFKEMEIMEREARFKKANRLKSNQPSQSLKTQYKMPEKENQSDEQKMLKAAKLDQLQGLQPSRFREYANNKLKELQIIKEDYMRNGGNDQQFIQHVHRLYRFYDQLRSKAEYSPLQLYARDSAPARIKLPQKIKQEKKVKKEQEKTKNAPSLQQKLQKQGSGIELYLKKIGFQQVEQDHLKKHLSQMQANKQSQNRSKFLQIRKDKTPLMLGRPYDSEKQREQNLLQELMREEVDDLRILKSLQGTKLYRQALANYKQKVLIREQLQRQLIQLAAMKVQGEIQSFGKERERQLQNQKWVDQQRKKMIQFDHWHS